MSTSGLPCLGGSTALPAHAPGAEPGGGPWSYNHACFDGGVTGTSTTDTATPATGTMYYYLVSRSTAPCTESSLGEASDGSERPNASPCP